MDDVMSNRDFVAPSELVFAAKEYLRASSLL